MYNEYFINILGKLQKGIKLCLMKLNQARKNTPRDYRFRLKIQEAQ